jgi:hypothetical protein
MSLPTAYELANKRFIKSSHKKESFLPEMEFIDITGMEVQKEDKPKTTDIEVIEPQSYSFPQITPSIKIIGDFTSYSGKARINRTLALELSNYGINVEIQMIPSRVDINDITLKYLNQLSKNKTPENTPCLYSNFFDIEKNKKEKNILLYNYNRFYDEEKIMKFDEIWTTTDFSYSLLTTLNKKIVKIPTAIYSDRFKQDSNNFFNKNVKNFKFLSFFNWDDGQNPEITLQSYIKAFSSLDDVSLILATKTDNSTLSIIKDIIAKNSKQNMPHISLFPNPIKESMLASFYSSVDCLVSICSDRTYGFELLEAVSCEIPIIFSSCSNEPEIIKDFPFQIKEDGKILKNKQLVPHFTDKSVEKLSKMMLYMYNNYEETKENTIILSKKLKENTWDNVIKHIAPKIIEANS